LVADNKVRDYKNLQRAFRSCINLHFNRHYTPLNQR
jgi:hypothetical protein